MDKKVYYINISDSLYPWVDTWTDNVPERIETDDQFADWLSDSFGDNCDGKDYSVFVFTQESLDDLIAKLQKLRDK
jgi:hypothetical protein